METYIREIFQAVKEGATQKEIKKILHIGESKVISFRKTYAGQWQDARREWKFEYAKGWPGLYKKTKAVKTRLKLYKDYLELGK